jgi:GNAT superfamily N-acetyltransferase
MEKSGYRFQSKTGLEVWVRKVQSDDAPSLVNLFEHMSPRSRFLRFQRPLENPDPQKVLEGAEAIVQMDPSRGTAWLAFADLPGEPGTLVAIAQFVRVPPDEAEAAVSVRDDLHGTGIGTHLLGFVAQHARAAGVNRLHALVQSENLQALGMIQHSPFPVTWTPQGTYTYVEAQLRARDEG